MKFQQALAEFPSKEASALDAYREVVKRLQSGTLNRASAALQIEYVIVPQWDKLCDSIGAPKLAENSQRADMQHGLTLYCDSRRRHFHLVSVALQTGDAQTEKEAAEALKRVQAQIEVIKRIAKNPSR